MDFWTLISNLWQTWAGKEGQRLNAGVIGGWEAYLQQGFADVASKAENLTGIRLDSTDFSPFGSVKYWDNISKTIKNTNQQLGIAGNLGSSVERSFQDAMVSAANLGLEWKDIAQEYQEFIISVGRNRQLTAQEMESLAEVKAVYGEGAAEIFAAFDLLGVSIDETSSDLQKMTKEANKLGLNTAKIIGDLKKNMGAIDRFNFRNGRKGLMEMAKLATETKISMESALEFADGIRKGGIEGAIEMGANLQVLGGQFAALGDPFELFYQARNAPEEFQKSIQQAAMSVAFFNDKTGEIDIDALGFDQLRELEKVTNIPLKELAQSAKMARKELEIENLFDNSIQSAGDFEQILTKVAGAAMFKEGEWKVNVGDELKSITDLTKGDITLLDALPEDVGEGDVYEKIVTSNESLIETLEKLNNTLKLQLIPRGIYQAGVERIQPVATDIRQNIVEGNLGDTLQSLKDTFEVAADNIIETFEIAVNGDIVDVFERGISNFFATVRGTGSAIWSGAPAILDGLNENVITPIINRMSEAYEGSILQSIVNTVTAPFTAAINIFTNSVNVLFSGATMMMDAVSTFGGWVTSIPQVLSDWWNSTDEENNNQGGVPRQMGGVINQITRNQTSSAFTNLSQFGGGGAALNDVTRTITFRMPDGSTETESFTQKQWDGIQNLILNIMEGNNTAGGATTKI